MLDNQTYKGIAYDGFTYFKPDIQSLTRDANDINDN